MKVVTPAGETIHLGATETAPTIGIIDYSRRVTDDYGVTTVVERGFARRMSVRLGVPSDAVDALQRRLADLRATAALWVADDRFASLSVRGFYKDFSLDLAAGALSYCTLSVEGLAEAAAGADVGGDPAPDNGVSTLQLIQPVTITDATLSASSVAENDAPAWAAGTTYPVGARVVRGHRLFESLTGGNAGADPVTTSGKWLDTGPTNRWAAFDQALGTTTTADGAIVVTIGAAGVDAVALLDLKAATVRVQAAGYDRVRPVGSGALAFLDLPAAAGAVTIRIEGAGAVSVGTLLVGKRVALGVTEASPTAGITDFSRKVVDDFGEVTIVERAWAKRMTARALIRTNAVDQVAARIAAVRARPSLWIGQDGRDSLTVYGFFKDFSITVGEAVSTLSLSIEGLSTAAPIRPLLGGAAWPDILDTDPTRPRPADGATNSRDPASPFGPNSTVGAQIEAIDKILTDIDALYDLSGNGDGNGTIGDAVAAAREAERLAKIAQGLAEAALADARTQAEDAARQAGYSKGSAESASVSVTEAGRKVELAQAEVIRAQAAAGYAEDWNAKAQAAADDADGFRASAVTASGVAVKAKSDAQLDIARLFPSHVSDGAYFTGAEHPLPPAQTNPIVEDSNKTHVNPAFAGRSARVFLESITIASRQWLNLEPGRAYKVTITTWLHDAGSTVDTNQLGFGFLCFDVAGQYIGPYFAPPVRPWRATDPAIGWDSRSLTLTTENIRATNAALSASYYVRPFVRGEVGPGGIWLCETLAFEDVTQETNAAGSASAAAEERRLAGVEKTAAGDFAAAADTSRVNAETAKGQAEGYRTEAATSASNALRSENTAATYESLTAQSAANAQYLDSWRAFTFGTSGLEGWYGYQANYQIVDNAGVRFGLTAGFADGSFNLDNAGFPGARYDRVIVEVERLTPRTDGFFEGIIFYRTPGHDWDARFHRRCPTREVLVGQRLFLTFDMRNLTAGGDDWVNNTITGLRLDLDDGRGADWRIWSIRVVGADSAAPLKSVEAAREQAGIATTRSDAAGEFARAAEASRNTANGAAGRAEGFRDEAATYRNDASGFAVSAQQAAGVAAQTSLGTLNRNPTFSGWTTGSGQLPNGWSDWAAGWNNEQVQGINGSPWALRYHAPANEDRGILQVLDTHYGAFVLEVDVQLVDGADIRGAGVLVQAQNEAINNEYGSYAIDFHKDAENATNILLSNEGIKDSAARRRRTYTRYFETPIDGGIAKIVLYAMANYGGFADGVRTNKAIDFHNVRLRYATEAEVMAKRADRLSGQLVASVDRIDRAFVDNNKAVALSLTGLTSRVNSRPNLLPYSNGEIGLGVGDLSKWRSNGATFYSSISEYWGPCLRSTGLTNSTVVLESPVIRCAPGATYTTSADLLFSTDYPDPSCYIDMIYLRGDYSLLADSHQRPTGPKDFSDAPASRDLTYIETVAPAGSVYMYMRAVYQATSGSHRDLGLRKAKIEQGQGPWTQYSAEATLQQAMGTIADQAGRLKAFYQLRANAGTGAEAFFELVAETGPGQPPTSNVSIGAREFHVYNSGQGGYYKVLSIIDGAATFSGALTAQSINTRELAINGVKWSRLDTADLSRIGANAWAGQITPGPGQTIEIPIAFVLANVHPGGRFTSEIVGGVVWQNPEVVTSTYQGKPFITTYLREGGLSVQLLKGDGQTALNLSDRKTGGGYGSTLATSENLTVRAFVSCGNYDSGIVNDGDYYYRQISDRCTITNLRIVYEWIGV